MLDIVASYHCMQFQVKHMIQLNKVAKKTHFGLNLGPLVPDLGHKIFIFRNLAPSVTRCHGQLSSCTISKKSNDPILRKFGDRHTDEQTDGRE